MFYTNVLERRKRFVFVGYDDEGNRIKKDIEGFNPTFYTSSIEKTEYRSQSGIYLNKHEVTVDKWRDIVFEGRGNIAREQIYGDMSPAYQYVQQVFNKKENYYDLNMVKVAIIDIEVVSVDGFPNPNKAEYPVTSITIKCRNTGMFYVLSTKDFDVNKIVINVDKSKINFKKLDTENNLLKSFIYVMKKLDCDVISGWGIASFDIPYLSNRIVKQLGDDALDILSPIGWTRPREEYHVTGGNILWYDFYIPIYDYLKLYKKFTYTTQESYSLNNIASTEIEKIKLEYSGDLTSLWETDPQKYIEYNIWDVELVSLIDEKMNLIDLGLTIAYETKSFYGDIFYPVRIWESVIHDELKNRGMEINPGKKRAKIAFPGAYVKEPNRGLQKWIFSIDLNSLYPNVAIGCNLSKGTLIDVPHPDLLNEYSKFNNYEEAIVGMINGNFDFSLLKKYNVTMTPNGYFWKKDRQGVVGYLMEKFYNQRVAIKKQMKTARKNKDEKQLRAIDLKQQALKILLNSGYGAFGNEHFRHFDVRVASGITTTGQFVIRYLEKRVQEDFNDILDVVYLDTDSLYISLEKFVMKNIWPKTQDTKEIIILLESFTKKFVDVSIKRVLNEIHDKLNMFKGTFEMKREIIGDRAIWATKKKYAVRVLVDDEIFLDEPKTKVMGMEIVRTSTPMLVRQYLRGILNVILDGNFEKLERSLKDFKEIFFHSPPSAIASPRSVSDMNKCFDRETIYKKATPIHVRGSLLHNYLIEKHELKHIRRIKSGDKIKFLYLKKPNIINENIISFIDELPIEFGLNGYIDYKLQFEKTAVSPILLLTKAVGFDFESVLEENKKVSITDMFGL